MAGARTPCYAPRVLNLPYNLQWPEVLVLASVLVLILAPRGLADVVRVLRGLSAAARARLTRPDGPPATPRPDDEI